MLGGYDVLLLAPSGECIADAILRACRSHWQGSVCVFQNTEETTEHLFSDPWVWNVGTSSRDFFVYRDQDAAASWEEHGAVKENRNTMFQFLIGDSLDDTPEWVEVAVVFDSYTPIMKRFIKKLHSGFLALTPLPRAA